MIPMRFADTMLDMPDEILTREMNKLWDPGFLNNLDEESFASKLVALRKDDDEISEKFRPILVANLIVKIIETRFKEVLERMVEEGNLNKYQAGFIKTEGTHRHIYTAAKSLREGCTLVTIDAANAYNSISWDHLDRMLLDEGNYGSQDMQERKFIKSLYKRQAMMKGDGS